MNTQAFLPSPLHAGLAFFMSLALSPGAMAQTSSGAPSWELGGFAGALSQQAFPAADQQLNPALALPYFVYRGDVLRADRDTAGIRAFKTDQFKPKRGVACANWAPWWNRARA